MSPSPNLVRQNAAVLRHIAAALPFEPGIMTLKGMAEALGRDVENLRKTVKNLIAGDLVEETGLTAHAWQLTDAGKAALADLPAEDPPAPAAPPAVDGSGLVGLRHDQLVPNPLNPRKDFDDEAIDLLRQSILQDGLLQNLVVRPAATLPGGEKLFHAIVAGESRWRAIGAAIHDGDWPEDRLIPCKVIDVDDQRHSELALIENLRRRDLKPLEEARAFKSLVEDFKLGTAEIAERISVNQRVVQQRIQLLELDPKDQARLELPKGDPNRLTVEKAREVLAARPKPIILDDDQWLLLAEIAESASEGKAFKGYQWCRASHQARLSIQLQALISRGLVSHWVGADHLETIQLKPEGAAALELHVPALKSRRQPTLEALRQRARRWPGHQGRFAWSWLEAPFEMHPDEAAEMEKQRQRQEALQAEIEERARVRQQAILDQEREEREAHAAGLAFLAEVRALEASARDLDRAAVAERYAGLLDTHSLSAPWVLVLSEDGKTPEMVTDNGVKMLPPSGPHLEAMRRMIALAINFTCGLDVFSGEPLETPWSPQPTPLEAAIADAGGEAEDEEPALTGDDFSRQIREAAGA